MEQAGSEQEAGAESPLDAQAMLRAEFAHVLGGPRWTEESALPLDSAFKALHSLPDEQRPTALCLSGGGIRSATFCLGVLQWLAGKRQLHDFQYLSTVSGGGYIGSWLVNGLVQAGSSADQWLDRVGQSAGSVDSASAAGAARAAGDARDPIAPLRAFSNYLSPTGGLSQDAFSLAAIFVRNLLLNALVWLPLLAALVGLPRLYIAVLGYLPQAEHLLFVRLAEMPRRFGFAPSAHELAFWAVTGLAWLTVVVGIAYVVADLPAQHPAPRVPTAPDAAARREAADPESKPPRDRFTLLCFAPIAAAAIVLSIGGAWITTLRGLDWWQFPLAGAAAHLLGMGLGWAWRRRRQLPTRERNLIGLLVVLLVGAVGGWLAWVALSQLGGEPADAADQGSQRLLYAVFAVPAMTGAFWLAMALYAALMGRFTDEQDREWWARATGAWLKFSAAWIVVFALIVWLPLPILDRLGASGPTALQFGVGGGLLGVLTSLIGYWGKNGGEIKRKAQGFLRATGLKLLDAMAALVLLATLLALTMGWNVALDRCHDWSWTARLSLCASDLHAQTELLRERTALRDEHASAAGRDAAAAAAAAAAMATIDDTPSETGRSAAARVYQHVLLEADGATLAIVIAVLLAFSAGLALAMGVNVFSLHGMYGNRLVRAYLGAGRALRRPHWFTGFDPADNPALERFRAPLRGADGRPRLFPVINIALNIVRPSPQHLDWQQRKAASFIATPLHCGALVVNYRPTDRYAGGMSLGRAMTISGAAASPNMGYHSSALVTFVMTLFNVRLGWWSPNPARTGDDRWTKAHPLIGLNVALNEATGRTGVDDPFVYLSDGGHFDNLGIYEMVRRRCRRIVAVDATCDGKFEWADLLDVVRKVRVDLGIPIELPSVLPDRISEQRCVTACIRYSARDGNPQDKDGQLIVLKPRLVPKDDPPELAAYAAVSLPAGSAADDPGRFPHQSTADQFFSEQQFESYRLLGYKTAEATLGKEHSPCKEPSDAHSEDKGKGEPTDAKTTAAASGAAAPPTGTTCGSVGAAQTGGLGYLLGQMGTGAALASALTIGGTLGVAGTVALAPTELRLSEADRSLLKAGMALRLDPAELKLNGDDRRRIDSGLRLTADGTDLKAAAERVLVAANLLIIAADRLQQPGSAPGATIVIEQRLRVQIDSLRREIDQIRILISQTRQGALPAELRELANTLIKLQAKVEVLEKQLAADAELKKALASLKDSVDSIAPRRSVRGQEGGPR